MPKTPGWIGCSLLAAHLALMAAPCLAADDLHARPSLVAEHAALTPGAVNWIGVAFEIDDGWHTYWDGFNDTGEPMRMTLTLPEGFKADPLVWPAPKRYSAAEGILDHVYEREVLVLVPLHVPASAAGTRVELKADLRWLVCSDVCIPERESVSLELPVAEGGRAPAKSSHAPLFERTRALVPAPAESNPAIRVRATPERGVVRVPGAERLEFFPARDCLPPVDAIADGQAQGQELTMRLGEPFDTDKDKPRRFSGVLKVVPAGGGAPAYYSIAVDVEP